MTGLNWRHLAVTTLKDPATAARVLLKMQVPTQALWIALLLMAVLNTLLFTLSNLLIPTSGPMPAALASPIVYLVLVTGGLILTVYAIFWTGRMLGGQGALADVMVVIVWLQALRVAVQVAAIVLILVMPALSALLVFAAALLGIYILVHFVNEAHRLGSVARSAGVLIASVLAMALALSLIISLLGGTLLGPTGYV